MSQNFTDDVKFRFFPDSADLPPLTKTQYGDLFTGNPPQFKEFKYHPSRFTASKETVVMEVSFYLFTCQPLAVD